MTTPDASLGTADVYLVNSQPCSQGVGPGYATLPWAEAKQLEDDGYAVFGTSPPLGLGYDGPVSPP
jgi:hypothetical protein